MLKKTENQRELIFKISKKELRSHVSNECVKVALRPSNP